MEACGALKMNVSPLFYTEVLTLSLFYASLWSNRVDAGLDRAAAAVRARRHGAGAWRGGTINGGFGILSVLASLGAVLGSEEIITFFESAARIMPYLPWHASDEELRMRRVDVQNARKNQGRVGRQRQTRISIFH